FFSSLLPPPRSTLFPYTTLFRSWGAYAGHAAAGAQASVRARAARQRGALSRPRNAAGSSAGRDGARRRFRRPALLAAGLARAVRSEEHTSELQSRGHLVCRLLLE